MKKNSLNILITGTGGSPTPRGFARSLKELSKYKNYRLVWYRHSQICCWTLPIMIFLKSHLSLLAALKPVTGKRRKQSSKRMILTYGGHSSRGGSS